jgi:hypothetical protein
MLQVQIGQQSIFSTGAIKSVDKGRAGVNFIALFTTASQARQRSTGAASPNSLNLAL